VITSLRPPKNQHIIEAVRKDDGGEPLRVRVRDNRNFMPGMEIRPPGRELSGRLRAGGAVSAVSRAVVKASLYARVKRPKGGDLRRCRARVKRHHFGNSTKGCRGACEEEGSGVNAATITRADATWREDINSAAVR
jgi:hypothetical protein